MESCINAPAASSRGLGLFSLCIGVGRLCAGKGYGHGSFTGTCVVHVEAIEITYLRTDLLRRPCSFAVVCLPS
jgi:hypothetical protein